MGLRISGAYDGHQTTPAVVVPNRFPGAPQFCWAVETPDRTFILDAENWLCEGAQVQVSYDPDDPFAFLLGAATTD